jgi:preprotein translocase subunit SecG
MNTILIIAQIIVCLLLIGLILLQVQGTGLGSSSLFGGGGEFYSSKRGVEKFVFAGTILLAVIFAGLSIALLVLK